MAVAGNTNGGRRRSCDSPTTRSTRPENFTQQLSDVSANLNLKRAATALSVSERLALSQLIDALSVLLGEAALVEMQE